MNQKNKIRNAITTGLISSFIEGVLIFSVDPTIYIWSILQGIFAWFSFGFVIYLINKSNHVLLKSILLTILLNLPWYISESIGNSKPEHLLPLIIASIIMGGIIGVISKLLDNKRI